MEPNAPKALAVDATGDLYVVDLGRDQILRRTAHGQFVVVAGDGRRGFAGDGGPAVDAELRLQGSSVVAISKNGAVILSDSGNSRVREVLTDGDIETLAGGGRTALPESPSEEIRATSAALGATAGLAFGPDGDLYIAGTFIVRVSRAGQLTWVAGSRNYVTPTCTANGCTIGEHNFGNVDALAFDGAGDLVVTSNDFPDAGFGIAEIRSNGRLVDLGSCRGEGGEPGAVASGPSGGVICASQSGLYEIADGSETQRAIDVDALSGVLGPLPSPNPGHLDTGFVFGNGLAVSKSGAIYVDTTPDIGTSVSAIAEIEPSRRGVLLWSS